jgi:hypothetical protein
MNIGGGYNHHVYQGEHLARFAVHADEVAITPVVRQGFVELNTPSFAAS